MDRFSRSSQLLDGAWHHVTFGYNQTEQTMYIDGQLMMHCVSPAPITPIPNPSTTLNGGLYDVAIGSANSGPYGGYM
jgi:hypothetical protein